MIAPANEAKDELMDILEALINQLQDAEIECIKLRHERDVALSKLAEITQELDRALEQIVRMQAK